MAVENFSTNFVGIIQEARANHKKARANESHVLKRIIKIFVWTIVGLYMAVVILLHIPFVQSSVGGWASRALSEKFGTKVTVGRVDLGFINRLIIDDSEMLDQQGKQMLNVARISVKISLRAIVHGQIEITSAQFFGLRANLYKATPEAKPNFTLPLH